MFVSGQQKKKKRRSGSSRWRLLLLVSMAAERRQLQSHSPESITADDPLTSARGYLNLNRSDLLSPRCGMLICIWKVLHLLALKEREATRCDVNPRGTSKQLLSETSLGLSKLVWNRKKESWTNTKTDYIPTCSFVLNLGLARVLLLGQLHLHVTHLVLPWKYLQRTPLMTFYAFTLGGCVSFTVCALWTVPNTSRQTHRTRIPRWAPIYLSTRRAWMTPG